MREPLLRNVPAPQSQEPTQLKINAVSVRIWCVGGLGGGGGGGG